MNLTQLRYFASVANCQSFSKAALEIHVAQPALTRQIRLLEEELQIQLLVRHNRGAQPTEAGVALMKVAESVLHQVEQIRKELVARTAAPSGSLRLGFVPSLGTMLVSKVVTQYQKAFPGVFLHLMEAFSHTLHDWLLSDKVDLVLMSNFGANPLLAIEPLFDEDLWLLAPGPFRPSKPIKSYSIDDLRDTPLIQLNRLNHLRVILDNAAHSHGLKLNVIMEAQGWAVVRELVNQGVGYTICPYSAAKAEIDKGEFGGHPIRELSLSRVLGYRLDRPITRAMSEMMSMFRGEAKKIIDGSGKFLRNPESKKRPGKSARRSPATKKRAQR